MLAIARSLHVEMVAHAYDCYPEEACGLLIGHALTKTVARFVPCENTMHSAKVYSVGPKDLLLAERRAERDGLEVIGVMHSHTHTDPYPSATDIRQAPDPTWHYVIVGLKREAPEVRSYQLVDGVVTDEPIAIG